MSGALTAGNVRILVFQHSVVEIRSEEAITPLVTKLGEAVSPYKPELPQGTPRNKVQNHRPWIYGQGMAQGSSCRKGGFSRRGVGRSSAIAWVYVSRFVRNARAFRFRTDAAGRGNNEERFPPLSRGSSVYSVDRLSLRGTDVVRPWMHGGAPAAITSRASSDQGEQSCVTTL